MEKSIDIICAGEILIDFIGHETNTSIENTTHYQRFIGGSPTNVAINAARLGLKTVLVASCGKDGLGEFLIKKLQDNKVSTSSINQLEESATSIILVSKSTGTPDFIPYRQADFHIEEYQLSDDLLRGAKVFHTTSFALSRNPARTTILKAAQKAKSFGVQTSIDFNFSEKIWPDRHEAAFVLKEYLSTNPLVKLSEDDCFRFFATVKSEEFIFDYFHGMGAATVCLTKGKDGVVLSNSSAGLFHQKAMVVAEVKDATGAGDAFWAGFLYAHLLNKNFEKSIEIAQKLAFLKLQNIGELPEGINFKEYLNN